MTRIGDDGPETGGLTDEVRQALRAVVTSIQSVDSKIDALRQSVDSKVEALQQEVRITREEVRITREEVRVTREELDEFRAEQSRTTRKLTLRLMDLESEQRPRPVSPPGGYGLESFEVQPTSIAGGRIYPTSKIRR